MKRKPKRTLHVEREEFTLNGKDVGRYVVKSDDPKVTRRCAEALRKIMEADGYKPKASR